MQDYIFPKDFVWGVATASYQIEGAVDEDGRGESIWDRFSHIPGNILNDHNGDTACDHYHRWQEDIQILKELGIPAYRFSIAWPRIYPNGWGQVNEKGLQFYSELVDHLLANGIEPYVTLYHWDLPQALQDEGGWVNPRCADHFAQYCKTVFDALGGRVRHWITLNEPWVAAFHGYYYGNFAPGVRDFTAALQAAHNMLRGHGMAVRLFRELGVEGDIGLTLNLCPRSPASDSPEDRAAARRHDGFANRWFLDAVYRGAYPQDMLSYYRDQRVTLPEFTQADMNLIATPFDFLGINYYNIDFTGAAEGPWPLNFALRDLDLPYTEQKWPITEYGLTDLLTWLDREYDHPVLYVTENGASYLDVKSIKGEVLDDCRIDYLERHIMACHSAMARGVDLRGYFVWTLVDNFEWNTGFKQKFGLVYLDRETCDRTVKKSGRWYGGVIRAGGIFTP